MRYGQIRQYDVANGPGIRTSIFVTGCRHHCPDCFNLDYQDFQAGDPWTDQETRTLVSYLQDDLVQGLTILGGEPFEHCQALSRLLEEIKQEVDKEIWIYSGFLYEDLIQDPQARTLLSLCHVLVDGPFIREKKDLSLRFRGSSNQRIIDLKKSLGSDQVYLWDEGADH